MALQGLGKGRKLQRAGRRSLGEVMEVFCMSIWGAATGLYTFLKTLPNSHLKLLDFIVCILYFNKSAKKQKLYG